MPTRYLYLVRHAQFDPNADTNPQGDLTALGRKQAGRLVKVFKDVPVHAIHASTLPRAWQTAEPLAHAFPEVKIERTRRLWECVPPVTPAIRAAHFGHLTDTELSLFHDQAERAVQFYLKGTTGTDKHEVLVSHGNLIRYFVCRVLGGDGGGWVNMRIANCSVTRISIDINGQAALYSYNETAHLGAGQITDNLFAGS